MLNEFNLFWEWMGVMTGLLLLFAIVMRRVSWKDAPEPPNWIDRLLENDSDSP